MSVGVVEQTAGVGVQDNRAVADLDTVNIALMLTAALLACVVPIELFAFSYVVLGPLHYLTQLNWLSDRRWFAPRRLDALLLALPAVALALGQQIDPLTSETWRAPLMGAVLAAAIILVITPQWWLRVILLATAMALAWRVRDQPALFLLALMLPSAIHIFVFTGGFILQGALRHRSVLGLTSFFTFATLAVLLLFAPLAQPAHQPAALFAAALAPFAAIRQQLGMLLGFAPDQLTGIDRFLGWAYSYHYLNWFSKTRLIGWHRATRRRLGAIGAVWALCVGLYAVDYTLGFLVVGCIGTLHVLLELPLDVRTFAALPRHLIGALRPIG